MSTKATTSPASPDGNNDPINTFSVHGKAVIEWELPESGSDWLVHPDPKARHILFEASLENDVSQQLSFLRLRIPMRHKYLQDITLYIHIPPHHISKLDWTSEYAAAEHVRTKLNTNVIQLRFDLHKPVQLIVPNQTALQPKRPPSADVIKSLDSLATALNVTIYLEHKAISKARLESLTNVINSGQSQSIPRYCDLHRLYEGIGGKCRLPTNGNKNQTDVEVGRSTDADSPPSYDEIGPGPPMPPQTAGSIKQPAKRNRQASGNSTDNSGSPSNRPSKRGTLEKDPSLATAVSDNNTTLQSLAQRLFAELAQVKEVVVKQAEVIQHLQAEVAKLRDQAKSQQDEVDVLEQRMDKTDVAIVDLDATAIQHGDVLAELEGSTATLHEYCDEYLSRRAPEFEEIRDELRTEVMSRLRNALESP